MSNFHICGTKLLEYRGNEQKVIVPEGISIVGEKAFLGNSTIDRIILPETIEEIQEEAFSDCVLLQKINLPEGLKYIGPSAFENCVKLLSVDLPESITKLEKSLFNRCKKLKVVNFGSNLEIIEELVFYSCTAIEKIILPKSIKSIGDMAFYKCLKLLEIALPKEMHRIGNNAFTLSGLRSVIIEGNITSWGSSSFAECKKLQNLTLMEGVRHIGDKAFNKCLALTNVNLPKSLISMGESVFYDSVFGELIKDKETIGNIFINGKHLSGQVIIPEGITAISGGVFYANEKITSVQLPNSLMYIGARAFCGCVRLKEIVLPEKLKSIEENTFAWCSGLESVSASNLLDYIQKRAFYGCTSLSTVNLSANVIMEDTFLDTKFLLDGQKNFTLIIVGSTVIDGQNCTGEVVIPDGITSIGPYAFANNVLIKSVSFPKSIEVVETGAFYGCRELAYINGLGTIERIGKQAFSKCSSLEKLNLSVKYINECAFFMCIALKTIDIPETLILGKEAFALCSSLSELNLGSHIQIGNKAFLECVSITTLSFDNQIIESHAFENCINITEIRLENDNLNYGSYAFSGCTALEKIWISNNVYDIDGYFTLFDFSLPNIVKEIYQCSISCFSIDENMVIYRCLTDAKKLHIPKGIKGIGKDVFRNAMQLLEITIPQSIEEISSRAFHSTPWIDKNTEENSLFIVNDIIVDGTKCKGEVIIPEDVKAISGWAFANCYGLTSIKFTSNHVRIGEFAFRNCFSLKKITLSNGESYEINRLSDREVNYPEPVKKIISECFNCFNTDKEGVLVECTGNINELVLVDGITEIGESVFKESNLLTQITLAKSTKVIRESAFEQCKWLTNVYETKQVTHIGNKAFSCCEKLEVIEFSQELNLIGKSAFEHCVSLKAIIIPEGITIIPEKAFYRCKNIQRLILPSTLKKIESKAFAYCPNLSEFIVPKGVLIATDAFIKEVAL